MRYTRGSAEASVADKGGRSCRVILPTAAALQGPGPLAFSHPDARGGDTCCRAGCPPPPAAAKSGKLLQLLEALPVVYECGPWAGCPLGAACPQAASQRPPPFRLEVFKTADGRGWGVRSLDMIPQYSFICR